MKELVLVVISCFAEEGNSQQDGCALPEASGRDGRPLISHPHPFVLVTFPVTVTKYLTEQPKG
jgi:hypothetical protein